MVGEKTYDYVNRSLLRGAVVVISNHRLIHQAVDFGNLNGKNRTVLMTTINNVKELRKHYDHVLPIKYEKTKEGHILIIYPQILKEDL